MERSSGRVTHFGPEHQALTLAERAAADAAEYRQFVARACAGNTAIKALLTASYGLVKDSTSA